MPDDPKTLTTKAAPNPADPCVMVIFGASGDLTKRKLLPALYNLAAADLLPDDFAIVGFASSEFDDASFEKHISKEIPDFVTESFDAKRWGWFKERLHYVRGDLTEAASYKRLGEALGKIDKQHNAHGNFLFYLATPPSLFARVVQHLGDAHLTRETRESWRRVVIEKPFGRDLETAQALNTEIAHVLSEDQVFRIDHYLGKETVQNILVFRFANGIFEPIWNRRYIDHVQITVAEELGVEKRAGYYEEAGALRDMVPNHLFQLLSLTAMEPPISFEADAVRNEKSKVLRAIAPMSPEEVLQRTVRGQYGPGTVGGSRLPAYRDEDGVDPASTTETFVALKLLVDNWRWADVPFYLRTGKRLGSRMTEITIQFKRAPFSLFRHTPVERLGPNRLLIRIQPDEGIALHFDAKVPGPFVQIGGVDMDFSYDETFGSAPATGYETLLYDTMTGDATLFQRDDNVEAAWRVVTPILDVWKALPPRGFPNYAAGSWGPEEADDLLVRDGRSWRNWE